MKGRAQTQKFRSAVTFTRPSIHFPYYIYARKIYVRTPAFSIKLFFLIANCIVCRFLVTQFLATKALGKNTLADMTWSDGSFPLFVRQLSQMHVFPLHFRVKFDQLFVQRVVRSRLTENLQI